MSNIYNIALKYLFLSEGKSIICATMNKTSDQLFKITQMWLKITMWLECRNKCVFQAMSFTPAELAAKVKERVPHFEIEYRPDGRQQIGETSIGPYF